MPTPGLASPSASLRSGRVSPSASLRSGRLVALGVGAALAVVLAASCKFDPAYRDEAALAPTPCTEGTLSCSGNTLSRCVHNTLVTVDACADRGQVCASKLAKCTNCEPSTTRCTGFDVERCDAEGNAFSKEATCDASRKQACRGGACVDLCGLSTTVQSNVGCEYWGVDLDNAVTAQGNAAAQQFAIVVSNPQPDLPAVVTVTQDDALPGQPPQPHVVSTATIQPFALEVFRLGPREVDGSPDGQFDTGTGTALTRHAYRVSSDVPIVAYQFNPLQNSNVFSNDASILLPTSGLGPSYIVAGWPQTIANSDDPATNFGATLRVFLTIVGVEPQTQVHVHTTARIIPGPAGGPAPNGIPKGGDLDATLDAYDVLNLETGDFNADFTGSRIDATGPVAVFVGSEASDAPMFDNLANRQCCADHLETQVFPLRTIGNQYAIGHVPNRSAAVARAGSDITPVAEPEYYRVVSTVAGKTHVTTTLPTPDDAFDLVGEGAVRTLTATDNFLLTGGAPIIVADVQASQGAAGVPRGLPGGDPSLTMVPPVEQWRSDYVFLTPDKYSFDFVIITARPTTKVFLDGIPVGNGQCEISSGDGIADAARTTPVPFVVYRCQLSFPRIDPTKLAPANLMPGVQNDGVHRVQGDQPLGLLVYGFDSFVSYAYAGGTDLRTIQIR